MMKSGYNYCKKLKNFYDINLGFFKSTVGSVEGLEVGGSLVGGVLPVQMMKLINVDEVTRRRKKYPKSNK